MSAALPRVRVLIVDDSVAVVKVLQMLLAGRVDIVGVAGTGGEAIQLASTLHPDVVLLDLGLPDLSGLDVLRKLKADRPDLRVLVLSGGFDGAQEALGLGAEGFLLKGEDSKDSLSRKVIGPGRPA